MRINSESSEFGKASTVRISARRRASVPRGRDVAVPAVEYRRVAFLLLRQRARCGKAVLDVNGGHHAAGDGVERLGPRRGMERPPTGWSAEPLRPATALPRSEPPIDRTTGAFAGAARRRALARGNCNREFSSPLPPLPRQSAPDPAGGVSDASRSKALRSSIDSRSGSCSARSRLFYAPGAMGSLFARRFFAGVRQPIAFLLPFIMEST